MRWSSTNASPWSKRISSATRDRASACATRAAPVAGGADASTWSLAYRELTFGHLMVLADTPEGGEPERQFLDAFARVVGFLLQRYEVRAKARALGYDLWFVGVAPGLLRLEERLEHVAALPMPLLIQGEFGCEARAAAFAAHVASGRAGPFVELRCGEAGDAAAFKVESKCPSACHRARHVVPERRRRTRFVAPETTGRVPGPCARLRRSRCSSTQLPGPPHPSA